LVPLKNGAPPEAPADGHSTQAGTLVEGAVVALPDDPPELAAPAAVRDEVLTAAAPDADPAAEVFEGGPEVVLPVAAEPVCCGVVAIVPVVAEVLVFAPVAAVAVGFAPVVIAAAAVALLPSLTIPLFVTA
jgi:hypothetical protein